MGETPDVTVREQIAPILPEPIRIDDPNYVEGHWDYPRRCADVELALDVARERAEEWDQKADPHGWWHERPYWIALHNEVLRLRTQLADASRVNELLTSDLNAETGRHNETKNRLTVARDEAYALRAQLASGQKEG